MESSSLTHGTNSSRVLLLAQPGDLSVAVVKELTNAGCQVSIVAPKENRWKKTLARSGIKGSVSITKFTQYSNGDFDFFIVVSNFLVHNKYKSKTEVLKSEELFYKFVLKNSLAKNNRTLLVYPYQSLDVYKNYSLELFELFKSTENIGVVLLGDVITDEKREDLLINKIINDAKNEVVYAPKKEIDLFPLSAKVAARLIVRNLFSFGPFTMEKLLIAGPRYSVTKTLSILHKLDKDLSFAFDKNEWNIKKIDYHSRSTVETDFKDSLKNIINKKEDKKKEVRSISKIVQNKISPPLIIGQENVDIPPQPILPQKNEVNVAKTKVKKENPVSNVQKKYPKTNYFKKLKLKIASLFSKKTKSNRKLPKSVFILSIFITIFILLLPFFMYLASLLTTSLSIHSLQNANLKSANSFFSISMFLSENAQKSFVVYSELPLLGSATNSLRQRTLFMSKSSKVFKNVLDVTEDSFLVIDSFKSSKALTLEDAQKLAVNMDKAYRDLSFLQADYNLLSDKEKINLKSFLDSEKLNRYRKYFLAGRDIFMNAEDWLGYDKQKRYAFVLQDQNILRPTGGIISDLVLVSIERGRITDISVTNAQAIQSKIQGQVEAPESLRTALNKNSWEFSDANWNPDFIKTASQISWFLNTALDENIDGVFVVNNQLQKQIEDILKGNFEDSQISKDPTINNSSGGMEMFVNEFLSGNQKITKKQKVLLITKIFQGLDKKDIMVRLNSSLQKYIAVNEWDGVVGGDFCNANCERDFVGIVESGIEGWGSNVVREQSLYVEVNNENIKRNLIFTLTNNGDSSYKSYVRLLVDPNSIFSDAEVRGSGGSMIKNLNIENETRFVSAGLEVEVPVGQTQEIVFSWTRDTNLDFMNKGSYHLLIRKEPGTKNDEISASFVFPSEAQTTYKTDASLTKASSFLYNTNLMYDKTVEVDW